MLPFYYRAFKYSWNEDRYRTPGVDGAKAVSEIGADGVALSPQGFPETDRPLPARSRASKEAKAEPGLAPEDAFLGMSPPAGEDLFPHPFHISSQWDSHEALRSLGIPQWLVALDDFAMDEGTLEAAKALSGRFHAQLQAVHIAADSGSEKQTESLGRRLKKMDASLMLHSVSGASPAEALLQEARNVHASLVILATHGRQGKERVLQGSVAEEVAKQSEIPVLIHRPGAPWPHLRKILLPYADAAQAKPALLVATQLAKTLGAELWLLHVREKPEDIQMDTSDTAPPLQGLPQEHSESREVEAKDGVAPSISAFCESEAIDLIVMPSHREDLAHRILPTGVTAELLRRVDCSVWVVPL